MSIVLYCGKCGKMFYAVALDTVEDEDIKEIAVYIKGGNTIGIVEHDTVREEFGGCCCNRK